MFGNPAVQLIGYAVANGADAKQALGLFEHFLCTSRKQFDEILMADCENEEISEEDDSLREACQHAVDAFVKVFKSLRSTDPRTKTSAEALSEGCTQLTNELVTLFHHATSLLDASPVWPDEDVTTAAAPPENEDEPEISALMQFQQDVAENILTAFARIPPGSKIARTFYEKAAKHVADVAEENFDGFRSILLRVAHPFLHDENYPGMQPIVISAYDLVRLHARSAVKKLISSERSDVASNLAAGLVVIHSDILVNFQTVPELKDRAVESFREDWETLKSVDGPYALKTLSEIESTYKPGARFKALKQGVSELVGLVSELSDRPAKKSQGQKSLPSVPTPETNAPPPARPTNGRPQGRTEKTHVMH